MRRVAAPPILEQGLLLHQLPLLLDLEGSTKCAARTGLSDTGLSVDSVDPILANIAVAPHEPQLYQLFVRQAHQINDLQHILGARLLVLLLPLGLAASGSLLIELAEIQVRLLTGSGGIYLESGRIPGS